jgi:hypothetical protein
MSTRTLILHGAAVSLLALSAGCHSSPSPTDLGPPVVINDNGGWCWYQDPRVVVDEAKGTLLVGSVAGPAGPGGATRSGDIDLVAYDLRRRKGQRVVIDHIEIDDHDDPALHIRSDGRYLVMYSNHNIDYLTRYRVSSSPHDARVFGPKRAFDWTSVHSDFHTTYNNVYYLPTEGTLYDFSRADNRSPNILTSADEGSTWAYAGKLTRSSDNVGYVNGYFKYASNGLDRIHFVGTEHHPYDYDTSLYHGIVKGGMTYQSDGVTVADDDIRDDEAPAPADFTLVFRTGSAPGGTPLTHAWPLDLELDASGNPHVLFVTRAHDQPDGTNFSDHRFVHARWNGGAWVVHELAKAGARLLPSQDDYTGLAVLNPHDLDTVYISSAIDPRDGVPTAMHEIYAGKTGDGGATWTWTPITEGSLLDNIRPIAAVWGGTHTALLWMRGTMRQGAAWDMAIVAQLFKGSVP